MSHLRIITEGLEGPKPFDIISLDFGNSNLDEGDLIEELRDVNPQIAVAVSCYYFGLDPSEASLTVEIPYEQEEKVKEIFDRCVESYEIMVDDVSWSKPEHDCN
jgi:hypothetical protein